MQSEFKIVAASDRHRLVVLSGVLDVRNAGAARKAIRSARGQGDATVSLDLVRLTSVDGSGVQVLLEEAEDARRTGRPLKLCPVGRSVLEQLVRASLLQLFGTTETNDLRPARPQVTVRVVCREDRFRFSAEVSHLPLARRRIVRFCEALEISREVVDALHLAVGEAVANAMRHGCRHDPSLDVQVRCAATDEELVAEVQDPGPGFDPGGVCQPSLEALQPGGMGIHLMRSVMDQVEFEFPPGGTIARLVKRFQSAAEGGIAAAEEANRRPGSNRSAMGDTAQ